MLGFLVLVDGENDFCIPGHIAARVEPQRVDDILLLVKKAVAQTTDSFYRFAALHVPLSDTSRHRRHRPWSGNGHAAAATCTVFIGQPFLSVACLMHVFETSHEWFSWPDFSRRGWYC